MPFNIGDTVNDLVDYLCNSTLAHSVISNPFLMALLLTAIIVSIFLGYFYGCIRSEPKISIVKLYIYSFLIAAIGLLINYRCQERDIEKLYSNEQAKRLVTAVEQAPGEISATLVNGGAFKEVDPSCGCPKLSSGGMGKDVKANVEQIPQQPIAEQKILTTSESNPQVQPNSNESRISPVKSSVNPMKVAIKPVTKAPF